MTQRTGEKTHRKRTAKAFLVVVLAAISAIALLTACGKSDNEPPAALNPIPPIRNAFKLSLGAVATQVRNYAVENGHVPEGDDVTALLKAGIRDAPQIDPWNTQVRYHGEGTTFVLSSAGPDRKWGTPDDIVIRGG